MTVKYVSLKSYKLHSLCMCQAHEVGGTYDWQELVLIMWVPVINSGHHAWRRAPSHTEPFQPP